MKTDLDAEKADAEAWSRLNDRLRTGHKRPKQKSGRPL
jgi:hypothetical protein